LYPFQRSWQIAPGVKSLNCGQRSPANLICLFRRQKTFERSVAKWGSAYAYFGSMGAYNLDRRTSSRWALFSGKYMTLFMGFDVYLIPKALLGRWGIHIRSISTEIYGWSCKGPDFVTNEKLSRLWSGSSTFDVHDIYITSFGACRTCVYECIWHIAVLVSFQLIGFSLSKAVEFRTSQKSIMRYKGKANMLGVTVRLRPHHIPLHGR